MARYLTIFILLLGLSVNAKSEDYNVSGRVRGDAIEAEVLVRAIPLSVVDGEQIRPLSKETFFRVASEQGGVTCHDEGRFQLKLSAGSYALLAFEDRNRNGRWDPSVPEAIGWFASQPGAMFSPVDVSKRDIDSVEIALHAPRHFPQKQQTVRQSTFRWLHGYPVLELHGDAEARGYAHGKLLAPQIIDFFRFYILEEKFRSAESYRNGFAIFLESHFKYPEAFVRECKALIQGMQESEVELFIPELERDFSLVDLYAINAYIETRAMRSSCTQFAAWGERTTNTDVDGGMITGRNMDGEIDVRRVTVSHFLLIAVDPIEPGEKRFVSMMWPGFVATISGINEDGFYSMENAGLTQSGGVVDQLVPFSWTMREALVRLGPDATEADVMQIINKFDNAVGGSCGPGCVTLFAMPYHGQENPAFVVEGDRFGEALRRAEDAEPAIPQAIVASNHHRVYGVEPHAPDKVFGREVVFSSRWRYEAGAQKLAAWYRTGQTIGTPQMQELLQTVAHGTTEYAIITRPNAREFDVALASMKPELWDAPYRDWTTFSFDELFSSSHSPESTSTR